MTATAEARPHPDAHAPLLAAGFWGKWVWTAGIHALVLLIVIADWLTPAGIVVGILLGVPILLTSAGRSREQVVVVTLVSAVGFILAAIFGRGPISPEAVWLPNRVFAIVAIGASSVLSLVLQRRRLEAEAARADAESARDLSQLLHSLMAHDLRSPLALARQALGAVEQPLRSGLPVDLDLITDVDARLRRSLRAIQLVLDAARTELAAVSGPRSAVPEIDAARAVREETASFEAEARSRAKQLQVDVPTAGLPARIDPSVLRQSVAILVDNAIRYAVPGTIVVSAAREPHNLCVHIRDNGPGLTRRRSQAGAEAGEGLGLKLCELLAQRAGGSLQVARDDENGTEFVLRLRVSASPESIATGHYPP